MGCGVCTFLTNGFIHSRNCSLYINVHCGRIRFTADEGISVCRVKVDSVSERLGSLNIYFFISFKSHIFLHICIQNINDVPAG